jgi:hypothetical protein
VASGLIDLGSGCTARFYGVNKDAVNRDGDHIYPTDVPDVVGIIFTHPIEGGDCEGAVPFWSLDGRPTWHVNMLDPLDISPSVLCTEHNWHGHIRQGRWVP